VRNTQKSVRNRVRLTHDALFNLHELEMDSNFVHRIVTHPDLSVIMYAPKILGLFRDLFISRADYPLQTLSYDTTFCLGDFYLSPLLFRHTNFSPAPIIPLAYLLHERKTMETHAEFFRHMRSVCPQLAGCQNVIIVTDQERAITTAIHDICPELKHVLCWNHVLQDCKRWLQQHGASSQAEVAYYVDSVSQPFAQFFRSSIHPVMNQLGAWVLRPLGLEKVTSNQSEFFNTVLKRLQDWKEAPLDSMALCLLRLAQYHLTEVRRGLYGIGEFQLRPGITMPQWAADIIRALSPYYCNL